MAIRYLEDFSIGEVWRSEPVEVTQEAIISFAMDNDPQPMHIDPIKAAQGPFGALVASGWQIAALSMRVFVQSGGYGGTPVVGMGIDELRWLKPVKAGDFLTIEREIVEITRSASRPDRGMLRTRVLAKNQDDQIVMSLYTLSRVPARPPAEPA